MVIKEGSIVFAPPLCFIGHPRFPPWAQCECFGGVVLIRTPHPPPRISYCMKKSDSKQVGCGHFR